MFSGGDYQEVTGWLANLATSHAKRENVRAECVLDTEGPREGTSYGLRVRLGSRLSPEIELAFQTVAANRGSLLWCQDLADRVRGLVKIAAADGPQTAAADGSLKPA